MKRERREETTNIKREFDNRMQKKRIMHKLRARSD